MRHGRASRLRGQQSLFQQRLQNNAAHLPRQIIAHAVFRFLCVLCASVVNALPYLSTALCRCIQFQAVCTTSRSPRSAFHCSNFSAFRGSATNSGGSPARLGPIFRCTFLPVACSIAEITCCTEQPVPVPRFTAKLSLPLANRSKAFTCAVAKSFT